MAGRNLRPSEFAYPPETLVLVGIGKAEIAITVQIEQVEYDGIFIFSYHRWCRIPEFN